MSLTYFKRYRMEIDLSNGPVARPRLPQGFRLIPWRAALLETHAEAKYLSFRYELDANVFPCLGEYDGCLRLMREIAGREGFLPEATWLVAQERPLTSAVYCGTIQGVRDRAGFGAIQNLGILPEFRDHGLGSALMLRALAGFQAAGLEKAYLEVTAQNEGAIRLYRRLGFYKARTVYKAVEVAYS
jgi:mycothiol synthase